MRIIGKKKDGKRPYTMKHSVKRRRLSQPTVALGGESYPVADPCTRYPIATLTSTPARKGSDKKRAACKSLKYTRGKKTKQNGEMRVGGGDGTGETRRRNHERLPIEEGCEGRVFSSLYIFMQRFPPSFFLWVQCAGLPSSYCSF